MERSHIVTGIQPIMSWNFRDYPSNEPSIPSNQYRGWDLHYESPAANGYAVLVANRKQLTEPEQFAGIHPTRLDDLYCVISVNANLIQADWKLFLWSELKTRIDYYEDQGGLVAPDLESPFTGPERLGYVIDVTPVELMFEYEKDLRKLKQQNG